MNLAKTSILTFIATFVRLANGFIVNKVIANFTGPTGVAFLGQFASFVSIITTYSSGAVNTGVIKYTAEYGDDIEKKAEIWSTAVKISLGCTIPVAIVLFAFSSQFSVYFFKNHEYSIVFKLFASTLIFFVLNSLMLSILNGQGEIKTYTLVSIIQSFVGLIFTGSLTYFWGIKGALIAYSTAQSIVLFATFVLLLNKNWFRFANFSRSISRSGVKKLLKFTAMAMTSASVVPVSQIFLRNYIGENLSWDQVGYWEGLCRITQTYLMLITTTLSVYYMPKLSSLKEKSEIKDEIVRGYKFALPPVIFGAMAIYFLREHIILLLYSEKFMPMKELFLWQLTGEVLKIGAWMIGILIVAKAMTRLYIITEILFVANYVFLSVIFISKYGLIGVSIAFALNYMLYWFLLAWLLRGHFKTFPSK